MATEKKPKVVTKRPVAPKTLYRAINALVEDDPTLTGSSTIDELTAVVKERWWAAQP